MQPPFYLRQGRKQIVDMAAEFFFGMISQEML